MPTPPQTVVELSSFRGRATKLLTEDELDALIYMVAADPMVGDLIPGTGGVRKVRFGRGGQGKRGGVRAAYFFYNGEVPIYMLAIYAKNEKSNLSKAERNQLKSLTEQIIAVYRSKS